MKTIIERNQSPSAAHFSIYIDDLTPAVFDGAKHSEPVNRPYHQLFLFSRATGHCRIDLESYRIKDNTVLLIPPDRYFQLKLSGPVSGIVLSFELGFLTFAIQGSGSSFIADTEAAMKMVNFMELGPGITSLVGLCLEIRKELQTPDILQLESVSGLFKHILVQLKRATTNQRQEVPATRKLRLFHRFSQSIERQYKSKKFVSDYATELAVTANYLNEVARQVTGRSASYHIQQRVVQEAKRQALYGDANMKMVAYSLGFVDPAHFSRFFRRGAGMNFSEFKKSALEHHYNAALETITQIPSHE